VNLARLKALAAWQKVGIAAAVAIAAAGVAGAIANPGRNAYEDYATARLSRYLTAEACPQLPDLVRELCAAAIAQNQELLRRLVATNTERQNYILFSIYRTELDPGGFLPERVEVPGYRFETVGALRTFYTYEAGEQ